MPVECHLQRTGQEALANLAYCAITLISWSALRFGRGPFPREVVIQGPVLALTKDLETLIFLVLIQHQRFINSRRMITMVQYKPHLGF